MNRLMSIVNAMACYNYLVTFYPKALVSMETTKHDVHLHFCDWDMKPNEVEAVTIKLSPLRLAGTKLEIITNQEGGFDTFTVTWPYWRYDDKD